MPREPLKTHGHLGGVPAVHLPGRGNGAAALRHRNVSADEIDRRLTPRDTVDVLRDDRGARLHHALRQPDTWGVIRTFGSVLERAMAGQVGVLPCG